MKKRKLTIIFLSVLALTSCSYTPVQEDTQGYYNNLIQKEEVKVKNRVLAKSVEESRKYDEKFLLMYQIDTLGELDLNEVLGEGTYGTINYEIRNIINQSVDVLKQAEIEEISNELVGIEIPEEVTENGEVQPARVEYRLPETAEEENQIRETRKSDWKVEMYRTYNEQQNRLFQSILVETYNSKRYIVKFEWYNGAITRASMIEV